MYASSAHHPRARARHRRAVVARRARSRDVRDARATTTTTTADDAEEAKRPHSDLRADLVRDLRERRDWVRRPRGARARWGATRRARVVATDRGVRTTSPTGRAAVTASSSTTASLEAVSDDVLREILILAVRNGKEGGRGASVAAALTCVSRSFRRIVEGSYEEFYERVDLSHGFCAPTDARVRAWAKRGVFKGTKELNLAGCHKLTDATLKTIGASCEALECLTLSGGSFSKDAFEILCGSALSEPPVLRKLRSFTFDITTPKMTPKQAMGEISRLIHKYRDMLEEIRIGREAPYSPAERRAFSQGAGSFFERVTECTQLRKLDLTNCGEDVRFPLFDLQRSCPLLEELKLNGFGGDAGWHVSGRIEDDFDETCFQSLRVLDVAVSMETTSIGHRYGNSNVNDETLLLFLYGSIETIETLDITGCTQLGDWRNVVWDRLPLALRTFKCARTRLSSDDAAVSHILSQLCPSLEVLELGCVGANATSVTDAAFTEILHLDGPTLPLRVLRAPGSALTTETLRAIVAPESRFKNLHAIDLAACRSLPLEIRRISLDTFPLENIRAVRAFLGSQSSEPDGIVVRDDAPTSARKRRR